MKKITLLLNLTLLFFFVLISHAQNDQIEVDTLGTEEKMTTWQMLKHDGASIYGGVTNAYTQPIRWKGKDWAIFGGIVAGSALLLTVDEPANEYFTNQGEDVPPFLQEVGFRFGKPLFNYGLTTGIYSIGLFTKNEKIRKTGVLLIASATAGGLLQTLSKTLVGRARPDVGEGNLSFRFWSNEAGYHSFPSGHAILSFTTMYAIGKQFRNPYIKGSLYALGLITPVSRMWTGAHWLTDVVLGVALSVVIVDGIDNYLKKNERYSYDEKKTKISWDLKLGAGQLGVVGRF